MRPRRCSTGPASPSTPPWPPPTAETVAAAQLAVAEAKVLTTEIALSASNTLFELAGTRSTLAEHNLDRHWRNARTHTLHDPVRWKYAIVGNHALNGVNPPLPRLELTGDAAPPTPSTPPHGRLAFESGRPRTDGGAGSHRASGRAGRGSTPIRPAGILA